MTLNSYISQFKEWYGRLITQVVDQIVEGEGVYVSHSNGRVQFYKRTAEKPQGTYISVGEIGSVVPPLAQSMYAKRLLKRLRVNLKKVEAIEEVTRSLSGVWNEMPEELKPYIQPFILSNEDYSRWWISRPFEPSQYPKSEKHTTVRGDVVRSKSEEMIANALNYAGIPYRYEAPLCLKGHTFYPDFTILQVKKQKEIYLEHFGMMSDIQYFRDAVEKLKSYQENGFFLGDNLLVTFEFKNDDLDSQMIDALIQTILR